MSANATSAAARPVSTAAGSSTRMLGFDVIRFIAACSVIWLHAGRSEMWHSQGLPDVGRWGTAFLNLIAGFFVVLTLQKFLDRSSGHLALRSAKFATHRTARIFYPFAVWSLLYLVARGFNYVLFGQLTSLRPSWNLLLWGTTYHLWFLPYLIIVTLATLPLVVLAIQTQSGRRFGSAAFIAAALALMLIPFPSWVPESGTELHALRTLYVRSPGYLLGVGFGLLWVSGLRPRLTHPAAIAALIVTFLASCALLWNATSEQEQLIFSRCAAASGFFLALAPWRGRLATLMGALGSLGFGVYLCHVLVIEGLWAITHSLKVPTGIPADLAVFVLAIVGSFALARRMRQTAALRWLVP